MATAVRPLRSEASRLAPATARPALVREALASDERAFDRLFAQHAPAVERAVRRLVRDPDLAADVVQDAWVHIHRGLPAFRGESSFATWAHRIAVNRARSALRAARRRAERQRPLDDTIPAPAAAESDPVLRHRLRRALRALPSGYRSVFLRHALAGATHEEIARRMRISAGTSKSQLFKARAALRRELGVVGEVWRAEARDA